MKIPKTYAEWSVCLDVFEAGGNDDEAIEAMRAGSLSWTGGVAPLFARRTSETVDVRLKRIADGMSRALHLGGDATTLARAMLDARQKLVSVYQLAALPVFADELRESLQKQVAQYAETAQKALEDSAKHDRSGQLASTIRNSSLLHFRVSAAATEATGGGSQAAASRTSTNNNTSVATQQRRRNILT
ncbi:hypothetical protein [Paraburkholderia azotifigens]|uniref:Uncharacterized protein n=1 Tax=Paraburkholderia azotifigens TaxID=2057004 RepID=A0A5C6V242_9BURK|nr:hypothetical protein [Paraburkholderia azotifigens]TXC79084.1 hypothetical protein FRZ40_32165 [Paraburkholderia azotifigens]